MPSASGDLLGRRWCHRMLAQPSLGGRRKRGWLLRHSWTLYSRQILATGFAAQRYFAVHGTDHRRHTEQNTASPPAFDAAAPAPSPG